MVNFLPFAIHRSLVLQNPDAIPWIAPSTKPARVNSVNPVRKPEGLPEIGHGLAGANAAIIPKGWNRTSKMAQETYVTARVVARENAGTFQKCVMTLIGSLLTID